MQSMIDSMTSLRRVKNSACIRSWRMKLAQMLNACLAVIRSVWMLMFFTSPFALIALYAISNTWSSLHILSMTMFAWRINIFVWSPWFSWYSFPSLVSRPRRESSGTNLSTSARLEIDSIWMRSTSAVESLPRLSMSDCRFSLTISSVITFFCRVMFLKIVVAKY